MGTLVEFLSLTNANIRNVVLGSILLTSCSALIGVFTFLRKKSLTGDAVAHAVLPGVCLGFLIAGDKDPLILAMGAFLSGWASLIAIDKIIANSKIKEDTAIGLVLSVSFGFGILLLTYIQHSGNANQSGLDHFLFGKAAAIMGNDLISFSIIGLVIIVISIIFFREFTIISFDQEFARTIGMPVRRLELLLTSLTVMAVVVGIQAVGVVLMAAMLITPAAGARFWTDNIKTMVILAVVFGAVSGVTGAYISYLAPSMPTGPWIVVVISTIALFSFFFAPNRGIVYAIIRKMRYRKQMLNENILKAIFHLGEKNNDLQAYWDIHEILGQRALSHEELKKGLNSLKKQGYVQHKNSKWAFTDAGLAKGKRITRIHRLWELYLTEYVNIAADHVHEDAETIEHIITPDLEKRLSAILDFPEFDPHQSKIPY